MAEVNDFIVSTGRQSLEGVVIDPLHEPKLRARIDRDSYDFQCTAVVEAWTTEQGWKIIHSVPIEKCGIFEYSPAYGRYPHDQYPETVNGRKGMPRWEAVMEQDLRDLMDYGYRFFS